MGFADILYPDIRSQLSLGGIPRNPVGIIGKYQSNDHKERPDATNDERWEREARLSVGSPRRELGSFEVIAITLIGFLFAVPGALLFCWAAYNPNWKRFTIAAMGIFMSVGATVTCYGWAAMGYPGWIWGIG